MLAWLLQSFHRALISNGPPTARLAVLKLPLCVLTSAEEPTGTHSDLSAFPVFHLSLIKRACIKLSYHPTPFSPNSTLGYFCAVPSPYLELFTCLESAPKWSSERLPTSGCKVDASHWHWWRAVSILNSPCLLNLHCFCAWMYKTFIRTHGFIYDYMNCIYAFNLFSQELVIYKHVQVRDDASFIYVWKSLCFQFTVCAHQFALL